MGNKGKEITFEKDLPHTEFRRLEWYEARQSTPGCMTFSMDDEVDRELTRRGLIVSNGWGKVGITPRGKALVKKGFSGCQKIINQDDFIDRLTLTLSNHTMAWKNPGFVAPNERRSALKPNLFTVRKTFKENELEPTLYYAFTNSQSSLPSLENLKCQGFAKYFYFVCPEGVISKSLLPANIGLLVEKSTGTWTTVVEAKPLEVNIDPDFFLKLMIDNRETKVPA